MKIHTLILTLSSMAAGWSLSAAPTPSNTSTEVVFFEPEAFTDVNDTSMGTDRGREDNLFLIRQHLVDRAGAFLPAGSKLSVTITNVDLAGDFEPWHGFRWSDVRIVKDIYPPRIDLTFRLVDAQGNVLKQGKRELRNMGFMMGSSINSQDAMRHEKTLLDDWLRSEFRSSK